MSKPCKLLAAWLERVRQEGPQSVHSLVREHVTSTVQSLLQKKPLSDCSDPHDVSLTAQDLRHHVIDSLDWFICDGDPGECLARLRSTEAPPNLCGRSLKSGEPVYICRDCGADGTCVLCSECFQRSAHRKHRYKMHTSGGSGFCDCGDPEAWKDGVWCEMHQPSMRGTDCDSSVPSGMSVRAHNVAEQCMRYAVDVLSWKQSDAFPLALTEEDMDDCYVAVLINDEIHSFDEVIHKLCGVLEYSRVQALQLATEVDCSGRSAIFVGSKSRCNDVQEKIMRGTMRKGRELRVDIIPALLLAHHDCAIQLLLWLHEIGTKCVVLRNLFCEVALKSSENNATSVSILGQVLTMDALLWKDARSACQQLFMKHMLLEPLCKKLFSIEIIKHYHELQEQFLHDDHSHDISVTSMSVQVFTTPSIAQMLVVEYDALKCVLDSFLSSVKVEVQVQRKKLSLPKLPCAFLDRGQWMLFDLTYLLQHGRGEWTAGQMEKFLDAFCSLLQLLSQLQGVDSSIRQSTLHVPYELDWEPAIRLQMLLCRVLPLVIQWCASDTRVLCQCVALTLEAIKKERPRKTIEYDSDHIEVFDVMHGPCTIHYPLPRLLASLLVHADKHQLTLQELLNVEEDPNIGQYLMEEPLRAIVFAAQVNSGYWRRNGYAVLSQVCYYQHISCRSQMYDQDIILLQACAAVMNPEIFIKTAVKRFGVAAWTNLRHGLERNSLTEERKNLELRMVEEMMQLFVIVLSERHQFGIGQVTLEQCITNEVIHKLCMGPCPHSKLQDSLPRQVMNVEDEPEVNLDHILQSVATYKHSGPGNKRQYEVKRDALPQFRPFFFHYGRSDLTKATDYLKKRAKSEGTEDVFQMLPGSLPEFTASFDGTRNLFRAEELVRLISLIAGRTACLLSPLWTEQLSFTGLYIAAMALRNEEDHGQELGKPGQPFTQNAFKDMTGCPKNLYTFDLIMKRFKGCKRVQSHGTFLEAVCKKFQLMSGQDPESIPTPDEALLGFLRSFVTIPGGDIVRPILDEKEKGIKTTAEGKGQKQVKEGAEPKSNSSQCRFSFWLRPKSKHVESKDKDQTVGSACGTGTSKICKVTAEERKKQLMDKMKEQQEKFVQQHQHLFQSAEMNMDDSCCISDTYLPMECPDSQPVALGRCSTWKLRSLVKPSVLCILCQEEQQVYREDGQALVYASCIQRSSVLCCPESLDQTVPEPDRSCDLLKICTIGLHVSSCGHAMHFTCWRRFIEAKQSEQSNRMIFRPRQCYSIEAGEFLCPLCGCFSNAVIPALPPSIQNSDSGSQGPCIGRNECFELLRHAAAVYCQASKTSCGAEADVSDACCRTATHILQPDNSSGYECVLHQDEAHKLFMQSTLVNGLGELPDETDVRVPTCTWNSCAYTLNAAEQLTRLFGEGQFDSLSSRQKDCLQALVQHTSVTSRLFYPRSVKQHCLTLLAALFCPGDCTNQPCILQMNALSLLVGLFFSLPVLDEDSVDYLSIKLDCQEHIIWLAYTVCVVQALLTVDLEEMKEETMQTDTDALVGSVLMQLRRELSGCVLSFNGLHKRLESKVLSFLRSAALLFHFLTDIPLPDESGGPMSTEVLSLYIGLPPLANLLQDINPITETGMGHLIQRWCQHHQQHLGPDGEMRSIRCSPITRLLIDLPHEYFDIVERAANSTCPKSRGETSRTPALCLVCGSIVCAQSYCCSTESEGQVVGASTVHSRKCSSGVGLYLYIRECQVVLLAGDGRGCLYPPPYFDEYGETDIGLKRGNPLYLCEESYKKLQEIWLKHMLYEVVVNSMEEHPNLMGITWAHI